MKKLIIALISFALIGCAGMAPKKSVCDKATESHLCAAASQYGVRLETVDLVIKSTMTIGVGFVEDNEKRAALRISLLRVIDTAEQFLGEGATYDGLFSAVQDKSRKLKVTAFVAMDSLAMFGSPLEIVPEDMALIRKHLKNLRNRLELIQ